jgi:hypothetical protein
MRKLVSQLFVSLDGVVESPERWHLGYYNEVMPAAEPRANVTVRLLRKFKWSALARAACTPAKSGRNRS